IYGYKIKRRPTCIFKKCAGLLVVLKIHMSGRGRKEMNYIKELNAFREFLLLNELPAGAISLWYTLMGINNVTRWQEQFNAPNAVVRQLAGLSRQGVLDARHKLIEHGLITCVQGKKGTAPQYEIHSLVQAADTPLDGSPDTSLDQSADQD